uniref:StAR related lipid transfer domain containing 6 n=1 Tax=Propithecus coquereli TaxID=379532 RepID=A0A2K6EWX5_PROCO
MDYKAIAQETAQEVLGYSQDTSGWKVVKISAHWCTPIVPSIWKSEAGGWLEPRSSGL